MDESSRADAEAKGHDTALNPDEQRNHLAQKRTELAEERTDRASHRTDLAEDRTDQAAERTFTAWLRTGITAEITGLAIAKLLGEFGPAGLILASSAIFIVVGAGAYVSGLVSFRRRQSILEGSGMEASVPWFWLMHGLVLLLLVTAIAAFVLVFVE